MDYSEPDRTAPVPDPMLELAERLSMKKRQTTEPLFKERLVAIAEAQLPERMGNVYTNVVISCLTCRDPQNQGFGDESDFKDSDGILVGVRYIEKVRLKAPRPFN